MTSFVIRSRLFLPCVFLCIIPLCSDSLSEVTNDGVLRLKILCIITIKAIIIRLKLKNLLHLRWAWRKWHHWYSTLILIIKHLMYNLERQEKALIFMDILLLISQLSILLSSHYWLFCVDPCYVLLFVILLIVLHYLCLEKGDNSSSFLFFSRKNLPTSLHLVMERKVQNFYTTFNMACIISMQ